MCRRTWLRFRDRRGFTRDSLECDSSSGFLVTIQFSWHYYSFRIHPPSAVSETKDSSLCCWIIQKYGIMPGDFIFHRGYSFAWELNANIYIEITRNSFRYYSMFVAFEIGAYIILINNTYKFNNLYVDLQKVSIFQFDRWIFYCCLKNDIFG